MTSKNRKSEFNSEEEMIAAEVKSFIDAKMKQGKTGAVVTMLGASDEEVANMMRMFPGARIIR